MAKRLPFPCWELSGPHIFAYANKGMLTESHMEGANAGIMLVHVSARKDTHAKTPCSMEPKSDGFAQ